MLIMDTETTAKAIIKKTREDASSLEDSTLPEKIPEAIKNEEDLKKVCFDHNP